MPEVSEDRWKQAQQYERDFWASQERRIREGEADEPEWYEWRAEQLRDWLRKLGADSFADGSADVLEVGSGPVGLVRFFPGRRRVAVDPLGSFYSGRDTLADWRSRSVSYVAGRGEELPLPPEAFDLVVMENTIDHVQSVPEVMAEIRRALVPRGLLYATVNARTAWGWLVHRVLSRGKIDAGHPHTFTRSRFGELLARSGFRVLGLRSGSYRRALWQDLRSPAWKDRLKGVAGISEFLVKAVAVKQEQEEDQDSSAPSSR